MDIRYSRNMPALTEEECAALQNKQVCIVGCGGLGGFIIELLARVGVGAIRVVDGDVFNTTNLNRQLLCEEAVLGMNKARAAVSRVLSINSGILVTAFEEFFTEKNASELLKGCDLAIDALDNARSRKVLAAACAEKPIPLVHGAISGWCAQVAVVKPGSGLFDKLYPPRASLSPKKGNLSFIASACASIQACEAVKLLCGRPSALFGKLLLMDLKNMTFDTVDI